MTTPAYKQSFIYLASPYSHKDSDIREMRFKKVCQIAAKLMLQGDKVFCPIAHSHSIETIGMSRRLPGPFWLNQDFSILKHAEILYVCMLPGWGESEGIKAEVEFALANNIPVAYIDEDYAD